MRSKSKYVVSSRLSLRRRPILQQASPPPLEALRPLVKASAPTPQVWSLSLYLVHFCKGDSTSWQLLYRVIFQLTLEGYFLTSVFLSLWRRWCRSLWWWLLDPALAMDFSVALIKPGRCPFFRPSCGEVKRTCHTVVVKFFRLRKVLMCSTYNTRL